MENRLISNNIDKNVLDTHLSFLYLHIKQSNGLNFRMLPFQKYDKIAFNGKYWKKFVKNPKKYIDFIGSYYVSSCYNQSYYHNGISFKFNYDIAKKQTTYADEAHVIFKLTNGYWVYIYIYATYSGLESYGCDGVICYCSKNIEELITYGIAYKYHKILGFI